MSLQTLNHFCVDQYIDYELQAKEYLKRIDEHLLKSFLNNLPKAKKVILNRLVESFIREDVLHFRSKSYEIKRIGNVFIVNDSDFTNDWEKVGRLLEKIQIQEGKTYLFIHLKEDVFIFIPFKSKHAFYRYQLSEDMLFIDQNEEVITDCVQFFDCLFTYLPSIHQERENWENVLNELMNGSVNLALSYTFFERKKGTLSEADYMKTPILKSLFFEQLCIEGHHLHPGTKTKMGMKVEDVIQYSPELKGEVSIRFVAVKKEFLDFNNIDGKDPNEFLFERLPILRNEFNQLCKENYMIIPIHPWQYDHILFDLYKKEIDEGIIIPLPQVSLKANATTSFRTVIPKNHDLFLKLAVHSQMTSTKRSVSIQTAMNGPNVSKLIQKVMEREKDLQRFFIPIHETYGIAFRSEDPIKSRNLTAMIREGINQYIEQNEIPIVASSFNSPSYTSDKLLLEDLFDQYCQSEGINKVDGVSRFIKDYCRITIPGYLTLMVKYGIGLEGHLQNSIVVFESGKPKKILFRDWGGARIYKPRVDSQGLDLNVYPNSITVTNEFIEMFNKVHYTVFQSHIGEVIRIISSYVNIGEKSCWKIVKQQCEDLIHSLNCYEKIKEHDRNYLFAKTVDHKSLTKMRLNEGLSGYVYVKVPNPLH